MARGKSRSRMSNEITNEVTSLINHGYLEIVLSGICLGSYGRDLIPELNLVKLIKELVRIRGCFRIRLSSIEINDITDELINIMKKTDRLCQHLHIPVQSGDERILKLMNRAYSPQMFINLIELIRRYMPQIAITTDVMVGFPSETELNFKNTIELIKKIKPARVHIFPYSKRLNTAAYRLGECISDSETKFRIATLQKISKSLSSAYNNRFISKLANVLIEKRVFGYPDLWEGYTDNYIRVRVKSNHELGNRIIQVRLRRVCKNFVLADIV